MMPSLKSVPLRRSPEEFGWAGEREAALASLSFLVELEASLEASQKALLALEVEEVEHCTAEQNRILRAFLESISPEAVQKDSDVGQHSSAAQFRCTPTLEADLLAAASRVARLTRVHAGLLRRAQQFLTVLGNLAAGPAATYGPPQAQTGRIPRGHEPAAEERKPCRA
jgi:hypothetical protein